MIQCKYNLGDSKKPVLALAIHNGHRIPEAMKPYTSISASDRFREEDPHTGLFAALFENHLIVETSRFAVDLNRGLEKCVYLKPEDAWGLETRIGTMPDPLYKDLLGSYTDWYNTLIYQVNRLLNIHPFLFVLDIHSFNHRRGGADAEPDPQIANPDIILGRSNMPQKLYPLVEDLRERLKGKDFLDSQLDVRCDVKFPGGQLPRFLHERYPDRVLCIAVEFKKIFMDEWTGKLDPVAMHDLQEIFVSVAQGWIRDQYSKIT